MDSRQDIRKTGGIQDRIYVRQDGYKTGYTLDRMDTRQHIRKTGWIKDRIYVRQDG